MKASFDGLDLLVAEQQEIVLVFVLSRLRMIFAESIDEKVFLAILWHKDLFKFAVDGPKI